MFDLLPLVRIVNSNGGRILLLDSTACVAAWLRKHAFQSESAGEALSTFLSWCLMRTVELAHERGFAVVAVECDADTWRSLRDTRGLAGQIYPGIEIRSSHAV